MASADQCGAAVTLEVFVWKFRDKVGLLVTVLVRVDDLVLVGGCLNLARWIRRWRELLEVRLGGFWCIGELRVQRGW